MTTMNYREAWAFLDALQFFKIKLGLDSMNHFLGALDNPHRSLPCVHIGGTNGKGSVGSTLRSILTEAGYKVGLYTSPHLSSVRERFRIDDRYISEQDFARQANRIREVLGDRQITYFEFTTTLAFLWFAQQKVDLALLEVGMGGRLDATNVVTPLVSVITNVSMDHEQYLGNTLAEIAGEKAGIIKPGIPVVSGAIDEIPCRVIEDACSLRKSPLYLLGREFHAAPDQEKTWQYRMTGQAGLSTPWNFTSLPLALSGSYQITNAALSLAALELLDAGGLSVSEDQIRTGLKKVRWPGRLEEFLLPERNKTEKRHPESNKQTTRHYLLDGAHNSAGIDALLLSLITGFPRKRLILVWAAMSDKDLYKTLPVIAPLASAIILTRPENERSATPEQLKSVLPLTQHKKTMCIDSIEQALRQAEDLATPEDLICVAGSLYLIGAVRKLLLGELVDHHD